MTLGDTPMCILAMILRAMSFYRMEQMGYQVVRESMQISSHGNTFPSGRSSQ
jgi:hypothetical protein